jgi:SH3 domain protein
MLNTLSIKKFAILSLLILFSTQIVAEIRYIDDMLRIPLRSGASSEHRIINFLNSGTKVDQQYLNENDNEWAFVTLDSNKEGWVQVRYLKNTPAARQLLALSQKELTKANNKNKEQVSNIQELKSELTELKNQLDALSKHSSKADKELEHIKEISKNAIRLDHSNNQLLEDNELLKASSEEAQQLITKLENNQKNQGIIYGALAVLIGIILGWIMPKMRSNRNDGWV